MSLFALVYEKIRTALARKQVRRGEFGWQLELDQPVTGRIEHDPESDLPIVTIDGRGFRWEHLGHMLKTFVLEAPTFGQLGEADRRAVLLGQGRPESDAARRLRRAVAVTREHPSLGRAKAAAALQPERERTT
jgi:hypothetical protein